MSHADGADRGTQVALRLPYGTDLSVGLTLPIFDQSRTIATAAQVPKCYGSTFARKKTDYTGGTGTVATAGTSN